MPESVPAGDCLILWLETEAAAVLDAGCKTEAVELLEQALQSFKRLSQQEGVVHR